MRRAEVIESCFGTLETALVNAVSHDARVEASAATNEYVEVFRPLRSHSQSGNNGRIEFGLKYKGALRACRVLKLPATAPEAHLGR